MPRFDPRNPLELAAVRMTRFLASKPRSAKTRAYLATLPKRGKIIVSPDDYRISENREAARKKAAQAVRDAKRYAEWEARGKPPSPSLPPAKRKDRLRPSKHRERSPLLAVIAAAQNGVCSICGDDLVWGGDANNPLRVTYDHVIPRALGGADHNNRTAAHRACNHKKANRPPNGCEMILLAAVNAALERHFAPPAVAKPCAQDQARDS